MSSTNQYKLVNKASRKIMIIGIPLVGILLTFPMNKGYYIFFSTEHFVNMFFSSVVTAVFWLTCMFTVKKLWKKYPWHLKPIQHISIEMILIVSISIILMIVLAIVYKNITGDQHHDRDFLMNVLFITLLSLFLTTFHEALYFYYQWKYNFNKSAVLEKDNVIAKYETLKNQINPHFLFNSLNTLLTFTEDNSKASKYVQNLSEFLRYTLKSTDAEIKLLRDEIRLVEKYCYLQKSRFSDNIIINIDVDEKYYHYSIPPLSMQIIVENAIKHNIISSKKPLTINIYVKNNEYLVIENNLQRKIDVDSTKMGLSNIKNRYKFLSAKEILIKEQNDKFIVEIPLLIMDIY